MLLSKIFTWLLSLRRLDSRSDSDRLGERSSPASPFGGDDAPCGPRDVSGCCGMAAEVEGDAWALWARWPLLPLIACWDCNALARNRCAAALVASRDRGIALTDPRGKDVLTGAGCCTGVAGEAAEVKADDATTEDGDARGVACCCLDADCCCCCCCPVAVADWARRGVGASW